MIPKKTVAGVSPFQPEDIDRLQRKMGLENIWNMAANENAFGSSSKVFATLEEGKERFSSYPDSTASILREKLGEHLDIDERRLIVGNGSDEIVQLIARTYLEVGTESLIADHTFLRYTLVTQLEGAESIYVPLRNGVHDLKAMLKSVTEKTRIVWICNPNNPTGTIVHHDELSSFLDQLPEHVLTVIDEAYMEYVTNPAYPDSLSLLDYNPRLLILRTFSKMYGLAAFRIGYGIGHPDMLKHLHRARNPFNVNRLAQQAAIAALEDETFVMYCKNQNRRGLKQLTTKLEEWGLTWFPSEANFLLFDTGFQADEVTHYLLTRGILVCSGTKIGFPTYLRVTIGTKEQNAVFLDELHTFLQAKTERSS